MISPEIVRHRQVSRLHIWQMGAVPWKRDVLKWLVTVQKLPITDLWILLNDSPKPQPKFGIPKVDELEKTVRAAQALGITVHFGTWMGPNETYARASAETLFPLIERLGIESVCIDAEGEIVRGLTYRQSSDFVWKTLKPAWAGCPVDVGITTFAGLPKDIEPWVEWAMAHHNGFGMPQDYSAATNSHISPRRLVELSQKTWHPFVGDRCIPIVAFYGQSKGRTAETALLEAIDALEELTTWEDLAGWTLESIDDKTRAGEERRKVLASLMVDGDGILQEDDGIGWAGTALGLAVLGGGYFALKTAFRTFFGGV